MSGTRLVDAVRELAACDRRSAAVLVRAPDGEYLVSPGVRGRLAGMVAAFAADRAHHASLAKQADRAAYADQAKGR